MNVWLCRAGKSGQDEDFALENGIAIIGWVDIPDLKNIDTLDKLRALCRDVYPDASEAKLSNYSGQLFSFAHRMQKEDLVVLPLKTQPAIAIGVVDGPYCYREVRGEMRHTRSVKWVRNDIPRTHVGQDLLYSIGAFMTVCRIKRNNAEKRFQAMMNGKKDPGPEGDSISNADTIDSDGPIDVDQLAQDQILGFIEKNFKGHELTRLVDAVLHAEGYKTRVSPPGPDGGVDILAGRGTLGFDPPRLCVQVKSSNAKADVGVFRGLQGSMQTFKADQGLLVSWGGFNSVVQKEASLSFFTVRLWDGDALVKAIFKNYDKFPEELQNELPLKRIWAMVLDD